jgi:hypothetical protein
LTRRFGARPAATLGVGVLSVVVALLGGCQRNEQGPSTQAGTSRSSASATTSPTSGAGTSTGVPRVPAPGSAPGQPLVVRSAGDRTSETLDAPPSPAGYVVQATCVGRPGSAVVWVISRDIGPVGDPVTGTVPCDGDAHAEPALPASTVGVRVRLRVDVDLSTVQSVSAELRARG